MNSLLITALAFICFGLSPLSTHAATLKTVDELIRGIEEKYNSKETFKADFKQIFKDRGFGKIESRGEVYFKRPGKMKWQYKKPSKKTIVSDGSRLWIYDYKDSQAILEKNYSSEKMPSAISFLWGKKKLSDVFDASIISVQEVKGRKTYTLELLPKEDSMSLTKLHFLVDPVSNLILESSIFDFFGNENRLVFSSQKLGRAIEDSVFQFKVPKGVRIVEPPKLKKKRPL
jgi:outer membrane lipoprotein carrier protein